MLDWRLKDVEEKVNALDSTTGLVMPRLEYLRVTRRCTESRTAGRKCRRMARPRPTESREAGHESWRPLPPSGGARARRGPVLTPRPRRARLATNPHLPWGRDRAVPGTGQRWPAVALQMRAVADHRPAPRRAARSPCCGRAPTGVRTGGFRAAVPLVHLAVCPCELCTVGAGGFAACLRPACEDQPATTCLWAGDESGSGWPPSFRGQR